MLGYAVYIIEIHHHFVSSPKFSILLFNLCVCVSERVIIWSLNPNCIQYVIEWIHSRLVNKMCHAINILKMCIEYCITLSVGFRDNSLNIAGQTDRQTSTNVRQEMDNETESNPINWNWLWQLAYYVLFNKKKENHLKEEPCVCIQSFFMQLGN